MSVSLSCANTRLYATVHCDLQGKVILHFKRIAFLVTTVFLQSACSVKLTHFMWLVENSSPECGFKEESEGLWRAFQRNNYFPNKRKIKWNNFNHIGSGCHSPQYSGLFFFSFMCNLNLRAILNFDCLVSSLSFWNNFLNYRNFVYKLSFKNCVNHYFYLDIFWCQISGLEVVSF